MLTNPPSRFANLHAIFLAIMLCLSASGPALALDVTPQSGLWSIDAENNGQPGRGFQIEVQNDILVLTFYGYDGVGAPKWWLAVGSFQPGSNQLTMELGEYEGGMAFGDQMTNAVYAGSGGTMTIQFFTVTEGVICLPKETCKAIRASNYAWGESASQLLGEWAIIAMDQSTAVIDAYNVLFDRVTPSSDPSVIDTAWGSFYFYLNGSTRQATVMCNRLKNPAPGTFNYSCVIDRLGVIDRVAIIVARNAAEGVSINDIGLNTGAIIHGWRLATPSGRYLLPN